METTEGSWLPVAEQEIQKGVLVVFRVVGSHLAKLTAVQLMFGRAGVGREGALGMFWFVGNEDRMVCALRTMEPTTPGMEEAVPATAFMVAFKIQLGFGETEFLFVSSGCTSS
jgi:hypothetical protein